MVRIEAISHSFSLIDGREQSPAESETPRKSRAQPTQSFPTIEPHQKRMMRRALTHRFDREHPVKHRKAYVEACSTLCVCVCLSSWAAASAIRQHYYRSSVSVKSIPRPVPTSGCVTGRLGDGFMRGDKWGYGANKEEFPHFSDVSRDETWSAKIECMNQDMNNEVGVNRITRYMAR
jgi:hypothetical protein